MYERKVGEQFYAKGKTTLLQVVRVYGTKQCDGCYYNNRGGVPCFAPIDGNAGECWDRPKNEDIVKFVEV